MQNIQAEIDNCEHIYLTSIIESATTEFKLQFIISEGVTSSIAMPTILPGIGRTETRDIAVTGSSRIFHVSWNSYIGFAVRDESYVAKDDYEKFTGKRFVLFSQSRYLDFIAKSTFATADYPGPFRHWGIFSLNHIVDVISRDDPVIMMG